jgi:hypothetical protein
MKWMIFEPTWNARSTRKLIQVIWVCKVTSCFNASGFKSDNAVLAAEGAFAFHIAKCHGIYKTVDYTSVLFKTIFPDSEIAHKFSHVQTDRKSNKLGNCTLCYLKRNAGVKNKFYWGDATDTSNHNDVKVSPVVIQCFDWENGDLPFELIEVP